MPLSANNPRLLPDGKIKGTAEEEMDRLERRMRRLEQRCAVDVSGDDELLAALCTAIRFIGAALLLGYVAAAWLLLAGR